MGWYRVRRILQLYLLTFDTNFYIRIKLGVWQYTMWGPNMSTRLEHGKIQAYFYNSIKLRPEVWQNTSWGPNM